MKKLLTVKVLWP